MVEYKLSDYTLNAESLHKLFIAVVTTKMSRLMLNQNETTNISGNLNVV